MDVGGGRVVVSKDIHISFPSTTVAAPLGPPLILRTGTLKAEGSAASEDEMIRTAGTKDGPKAEFTARTDSADNMFMEDVSRRLCAWRYIGADFSFTDHIVNFIPLPRGPHSHSLHRVCHSIRPTCFSV